MTLERRRPQFRLILSIVLVISTLPLNVIAGEQLDTRQFSSMRWRLIGPFRAGRVTAVAGVPGAPNTYYFGTPGGGVWKTTDGGRVWSPIFDQAGVASIGALAVAPWDPRVVYVGTGEQTRGRGLYRSADSGRTWNSVGLTDVPYIQAIILNPQNPDIVVIGGNSVGVGLIWRPLPQSAWTDNRGIFKTNDGGKTWQKVFSSNDTLGVVDMCADPGDPSTLYAVLYRPPSGSGNSKIAATSDIIRSSDGGSSWAPLESKGLPEKARGRVGIIVAPETHGRRLYAILDQGFFRSDDRGATWQQSTNDPRVIGSEYFSRVFADPQNPDVIYVAQTSLYRSTDGGKTFEAYVGAPSGDDFHVLWIDPGNSSRMILGVDQGAIVSVDGGETWSSWYNQPTGQFYHVSTDDGFPYRIYASQQDSGTAGILSRSDYGEILLQDWYSVGGFEYAFITPDPANPNFIYSGGWYGSVVRFDKSTGQVATVFERGQKYRASRMPPLVFSPQNASVLYLGTQFVLKTPDGGSTWQEISPDLTGYVGKQQDEEEERESGSPPPPAITSLAPSVVQPGEIWAGTSNRLVYLTRNSGATWQNVSPSGLTVPTQILYIEASHHDPASAYLTVGGTRFSTPAYVARTHDYGHTWQKIVNGFPDGEMVRVVREDPGRKDLLYAGTDTGVFVSWDDGDHWQPLSLNLPATPVTDLQVHGNDLLISTFGRGLWVLDDITPIRDITPQIAAAGVYLFPPATGMRVRWDNYQDTPYPIETPAGQNPPDGVFIDYFLKVAAASELRLTIYDQKGAEIAKFSSHAHPVDLPPANVPDYWFAPPASLSRAPGVNRFVWDLRYPPPPSLPYGYYGKLLGYTEYTLADHAVPGLTPRQQPRGPLVAPGNYIAELRYGDHTLRQSLAVKIDPRVHATEHDLIAQRDLALEISRGMQASYHAYHQVDALRQALADRQEQLNGTDLQQLKAAAESLEKKIDALEKGRKTAPGFGSVNRDLIRLIFSVESADMAPARAVHLAVQQSCEALDKDLLKWQQLNEQDVPAFNTMLLRGGAVALPIAHTTLTGCK